MARHALAPCCCSRTSSVHLGHIPRDDKAQLHSKFLAEADGCLTAQPQGNDEPLTQFVNRFSAEIRRMPDTHPTLAIQAFLMGPRPSRFFWSLIERPPSTVPEMLQRASQYVAAESLVVGKREDHKKPRGDKPQGQPSGTPKRRDRPELPALRPLPIPLNSTRTEVFLQIRDKGLLGTPNPIRAKIGGRDKRRYCRFHRDYGHDTEECNDLRNQIEDLIRQGHLHRFIQDRRASEEWPRRDRNPSPRPDRPIEKQIDVIVGGPASGETVPRPGKPTPGFTGDLVSPAGTAVLPVTVGEEPRSKTLLVSFIVVALPSAYNAIIGRPTLNKLRAVVLTYHRIMKFPTRVGVGEVQSDPRESRQCYLTATTLPKKLKASPPTMASEIQARRPRSPNRRRR
ncbi:hypothetical protein BHE74_00054468 [Ensete ventricosum]|nr:hypothetical protein BHE74_00054468 [Ensete ventricosum]